MRTILLAIGIFMTSLGIAQRQCATNAYNDVQQTMDPTFAKRVDVIEKFILQKATIASRQNGEINQVIRIPVVVHVIYKNATQNISDAQIKSQIDALNRDFRKKNSDSVNIPLRFKGLSADVQIEFELATTDPTGRATTGIIRKQTNVSNWMLDDNIKLASKGGSNPWDSRSYLNIWVGNLFGILGFASTPGSAADKDGLVIHHTTFGTINTQAPYEMGRTVVHEVGHWLGLRHIWGETYCGDDLVQDTPKQGNFTSGCPTNFRSSCNNENMGDMYMNYMDYTNDACMNMFTNGQKIRMLSLFNADGPRNSLLTSKGLQTPWNTEAPITSIPENKNTIQIYPNPVYQEMVLNFTDISWVGQTLTVININGSVQTKVYVSGKMQKINFSHLIPGIYFIEGSNGTENIRKKIIKL